MKNLTRNTQRIIGITMLALLLFSCNSNPTDVTGQIKEANTELMTAFAQGVGNATALAALYTSMLKSFRLTTRYSTGKLTSAISGPIP
ncbi:MAG: hypothetical protein IPH45_20845 [Bacteroidales bacterium]|nr:hypothetical protein [Bacteroidales bacterium]